MSAGAQAEARYEVSFSQEGKTKRMILPPEPPADDPAGCRERLTVVLALDSEHPIEGIEWYGQRGPNGYVVLKRRRAPEIAFEPAKHVNTPMRLIESVNWQKIPSDGPVPPFKAEHCRMLGHVIRCATDADGALDANQETEGIIGTFPDLAEQIEGLHTHEERPAVRGRLGVAGGR